MNQMSLETERESVNNSLIQKQSVKKNSVAEYLTQDEKEINDDGSVDSEENMQQFDRKGQDSLNEEVQELRQTTRYSLIVPFKVFNLETAKLIFQKKILNKQSNKQEIQKQPILSSKKNQKNKKFHYLDVQIPKDKINRYEDILNRYECIDSNDEQVSDPQQMDMNCEDVLLDPQRQSVLNNQQQDIMRTQVETETKFNQKDKLNFEQKSYQVSYEDQFLDAYIKKINHQNPLAEVIENLKNSQTKPLLNKDNVTLNKNNVVSENQIHGFGLNTDPEQLDITGQVRFNKKEEIANALDQFKLSSQYIEQLAIRVAKLDFYVDQNEDLLDIFIYTNSNNYEKLANQSQSQHEKQRQLLNKVYLVLEKIFANFKMSRILFNSSKDQIQPQVYLEYYERMKGRIEKKEFNQVFFAQTETFGFYQCEMFSVGKVLQNLLFKDEWFQKEKFFIRTILEQIKNKITNTLRSNMNNQKFIEIYLQQKAKLAEQEKNLSKPEQKSTNQI